MKRIKELALRHDAIAYIYAIGAMVLVASPLISLWILLYVVRCR